jgi:hypothetical protein
VKPMRPLPSRIAASLICLWATLLSIQLQVAGCASQRPISVADPNAARGLGLLAVASGTPMRVWLRDGKMVQGDYQGIERLTPAAYAVNYDAWRASAPAAGWPALGDTVRIATVYGGTRVGRFEGFDWGVVWFRAGSESEVVRFEDMRTLTGPSEVAFTADTLARLREAHRLPLASELRLYAHASQLSGGVRAYALDRVDRVQVQQDGRWVAAIIVGALAGAVMAVLVVKSIFDDAFDNCGGPVSSSVRLYPASPAAQPARR